MDLVVPICTFVLVTLAVMVWPAAEPVVRPDSHLLDGLREFVARRG
jgi:hypothetical protein